MDQPNLNYIKELSGGDASFQKKLIDVIKAELPSEILEYQNNLKENKLKQAAQNVHKLKHKLGVLSIVEGYELAIVYEEELHNNDTSRKVEFNSLLDLIQNFVNEL